MLNNNKIGLTLGIFAALLHAIWAILVAIGIAQSYLNWILPMHFIGTMFEVTAFNLINAILLIVLAFIGGYVCGWIFAAVYNNINKK